MTAPLSRQPETDLSRRADQWDQVFGSLGKGVRGVPVLSAEFLADVLGDREAIGRPNEGDPQEGGL